MADANGETTRFGWQTLTDEHVLEPATYNAMLEDLDANLPDPTDATTSAITPATGVVQTSNVPASFRHVQLTLTDFVVTVDDSDGEYGGSSLLTLPDKNLVFVNAEVNLSVVKGNVATGIGATDDISMGVGTAVASNVTLSTTMQNIVPVTAIGTDATTVTFAASSFSANGAAVLVAVADGASNHLYLNASAGGSAMSVDDTLTCTGTIDLWFYELGNVTS
jgi:hypothetical protein